MRPLRIDGPPDAQRVALAAQYLRERLEGRFEVLTEHYLLLEAEPRILESLTRAEAEAADAAGVPLHHPDIIITELGIIALIIEIDGSIHDTKPGRRATAVRDRHYADAGLNCRVLPGVDYDMLDNILKSLN